MGRRRRTRIAVEARRHATDVKRATGTEIRRQREDAGLSQSAVSRAAGISQAYESEIEAGKAEPSLDVLAAVAVALGGQLRVRIEPGTGPAIRDRVQARMVEAFLRELHPRWKRFLEMPVYRPIHGVIDLVLHDLDAGVLVAVEFHSQLRRLEQQIRWAHEKADALATSWQATLGGARGVTSPGVSRLGASVVTSPRVSRLLVLRSTAATRELARVFEETLRLEYPARTVDAHAACFREGEWPGSALLWASVDGSAVKILEAPPRGVALGR